MNEVNTVIQRLQAADSLNRKITLNPIEVRLLRIFITFLINRRPIVISAEGIDAR